MTEIPKKEVDFEGKIFIFHGVFTLPLLSDLTGYCNTADSSTMPEKQIAQASLLRDMLLITVAYLAPQLTSNGVGSGVLTQKFNCNFNF